MEAPAPVEEASAAPAAAAKASDVAAAASAPEAPAVLRHRHKRQRPPDNDAPSSDLEERLAEFQHSPHYLRIPASSVSALCGLHPFQDLPQLLYDLVYQSYLGQILLQRDAKALGLTVVDAKTHEQETMINLASAVLEVSEGKRKLQSVDEVRSIQKKIKQHATKPRKKGKLSHKQVESLVEASRGHVSTGFGTCHEDDALDAYEKQVGCTVRERNEALMEWRFERLADEGSELGVTAFPMGPAKGKDFGGMLSKQSSGEDGKEGGGEDKPIEIGLGSHNDAQSKTTEFQEATNEDGIVIDDNGETDSREDKKPAAKTERGAERVKIKPFFRIVGAVDGVRDELYTAPSAPPAKAATSVDATNKAPQHDNTQDPYSFSDEDEEQWSLRPIIVECKHRMNEAKVPPPLYDMIQTCLYCMMYNVDEADLIQVVRRKKGTGKSEEKENEAAKDNKSDDEKDDGKAKSEDMKITVTRVSLNDPIHNHSHHWRATLLPRLSSFVDAVYSLRRDDGKRYRLLMALVQLQQEEGSGKAEEEAWKVLWEECPWLVHCDTSFGRRRR
ncbi:hypothetical protein ACHAXT_008743 [Thalassiosira profunda]